MLRRQSEEEAGHVCRYRGTSARNFNHKIEYLFKKRDKFLSPGRPLVT